MIEHPDDREARLAELRGRPDVDWGRDLAVNVTLAWLVAAAVGGGMWAVILWIGGGL